MAVARRADRAGHRRLAAEELGLPTSPYRFVDFYAEITQLTVQHVSGTLFLDPVHHIQVDGDYAESWQYPVGGSPLSLAVLDRAREVAGTITTALGGGGLFGVELFVKGDEVIFSEVSPRPHDTGLVTLVSQDLSEFARHARCPRAPRRRTGALPRRRRECPDRGLRGQRPRLFRR